MFNCYNILIGLCENFITLFYFIRIALLFNKSLDKGHRIHGSLLNIVYGREYSITGQSKLCCSSKTYSNSSII